MATSCKRERSLLSHEEYGVIQASHHPEIYDLDLSGLEKLRSRLHQMRDKEKTLARQKQREQRGKAEPRGASFPGTAEQPMKRKQVFASALKRLNKEIKRTRSIEARAANVDAARRALAMRRAANFPVYQASGDTANEGMNPRPSRRRMTKVPGQRIGSISQAAKVAQARRDSRR
ncbi:hypothetical protein [Bradyrhizobium sp. SYSU BS000235]|uniref:hypothetical protein n=1 Tax=Bradyrhizobium sp. SYSU BS000235 TaxID=3411332 RepID=UPI003C7618D3